MGIHAWRQTQTETTIDSFYDEDFNILNPRKNERGAGDGIFRMEFPLMQWCVALLFKVFGSHIFITRICMFVIGLFSVLGMYRLLHALSGNLLLALIGAWAFNFSPAFYYYTINPLPDNLSLCCGIWGLALFFQWTKNQNKTLLFICSAFLSVATLCKLPFLLYYSLPGFYLLQEYFKQRRSLNSTLRDVLALCSFLIFAIAWYAWVIPQWKGNGVVGGIFWNDVPGGLLFDYLMFNLTSTLPELLINYGAVLFFIAGFYFLFKRKLYTHNLFPSLLSFCVALVVYYLFEMNMIARTHDYYLFPFYPAIFILVSYGAYQLLDKAVMSLKILSVVCILVLPFTAYLRMHNRWNESSPGLNPDLMRFIEELRKAVPENALCVAGNDGSHFIFLYYIHKKGWVYNYDQLSEEDLRRMIDEGAQFLYSDSRDLEARDYVKPFLAEMVGEYGSIRIFRLKGRSLSESVFQVRQHQ
ncbi:MAG: hypothetical protein K0Q95_2591 [Bacteroidota bacterium]|nr:hypothetical protein [Bacteroidota bacterium]